MSLRLQSLRVYKGLLQAINLTFKGEFKFLIIFIVYLNFIVLHYTYTFYIVLDDIHAKQQSKSIFKNKFRQLKTVSSEDEYLGQLNVLKEVSDILKSNVIQGVRNLDSQSPNFNLRFTPFTELGDNDSIKSPPSFEELKRTKK